MKQILMLVLVAAVVATGVSAQSPFNSPEEQEAFMNVQNALSVQDRASSAVKFIADYPNSPYVGLASYMAMLSYQQLNDFENMMLYGDMVLESSPVPSVLAGTLISLAGVIPKRTREFDLDKEEKLAKAEDYAKRAMALIPTLPKTDANMTDDAWLNTKMDFMSQCHEAIGEVNLIRENYEQAETSLRRALDMTPSPIPYTMYSLGIALSKQGKKDEAGALFDRCSAAGGVQGGDGSDLCATLKSEL